jgi:hypothetical protein
MAKSFAGVPDLLMAHDATLSIIAPPQRLRSYQYGKTAIARRFPIGIALL